MSEGRRWALWCVFLLAVVFGFAILQRSARGDDRFPWLEKVAPVAEEASSARRHRYRYRRLRASPVRSVAPPATQEPQAPEASPWPPLPFMADPWAGRAAPVPVPADSRFEQAFRALSGPIQPIPVKTVSFREPVAHKPAAAPPPRADTFFAVLALAAVIALASFAAIRALVRRRTEWEKLPPRENANYSTRASTGVVIQMQRRARS